MVSKLKLVLALVAIFPASLMAQFNFTGGPLVTEGECKTLWASNDTAFMGFNKNLYRTFNGGKNWQLCANGIPSDCDPRTIELSNNTLLVGTIKNSRIYTSTDFGDNFTGGTGNMTSLLIPTASTSGPNFSMIGGTTSSPFRYDFSQSNWVDIGATGITHGMAYVGKDTIWECSGSVATGTTQYSTDNGMTWTAVAVEPNTDVGGGSIVTTKAQDFLKVGNRILIASNLVGFAVLYSDDNGATWSASDLGGTSFSDYGKRFLKISNNHILSTNSLGLWKSTDKGATWTMIQSLSGINTMSLWKGDHVLIGTINGVFEYDNNGEGSLVKKHGTASSASNIIDDGNGNILTATANGLYRLDVSLGAWTTVFDSIYGTGLNYLDAPSLTKINDTIFLCGNGIFMTGDNGQTFSTRSYSAFSGQKPTAIIEHLGNKVIGTRSKWPGGGTPKDPKIFYSNDDGKTYTEATFTNNIAWGFGAGSDNYVEAFHQTPTSLVADMHAGYAISTDGGKNWTFYEDHWVISIMATKGANIYHYKMSGWGLPDRELFVSSDDGQTWTTCSLTGLPNSSTSNYYGNYGIWNAGGELYTYNSTDAPLGLYKYDEQADSWTLEANTQGGIDGVLVNVTKINGTFYGNWPSNGVWSTAVVIGLEEENNEQMIHVYPNPSSGKFKVELPNLSHAKLSLFDLSGKVVFEKELDKNQTDIDLETQQKGIYILKISSKDFTISRKIILR